MSVRTIVHGLQAQRSILRGVDALAGAVRVTLGPRGRNVLFHRYGQLPRITKDGVTVALEIEVEDPFENMGVELVRQVAAKTAALAGDGTTTAIVLAQAICREGMRLVSAGIAPRDVKRGLQQGLAAALEQLVAMSRPVRDPEQVQRVATICANGDEAIGSLVATTLRDIGDDGVVTVMQGRSTETTRDIVKGLHFDRGFLSPYFVTDIERVECVLEDACVLIAVDPIRGMQALVPILEAVLEAKKPLLVVVDELAEEALATLVINKLRGNLACCAVRCPGVGPARTEDMRDLAFVTGATMVAPETGLTYERLKLEHLGACERAVVTPDFTTVVGGAGSDEHIQGRLASLRKELERLKGDKKAPEASVNDLERRTRRLARGVATVKVGGLSETELQERKDRIEDAFAATRSAINRGVVPGGGVALLRCQPALERLLASGGEANPGIRILRDALEQPLFRIAENAGLDGTVVVGKVREGEGSFGFDAALREYRDLEEAGILDSTKVVQSALQCAVDVVGLMLTTGAMLADKYEPPPRYTPYRPDLFDDD